MRMKHLIVISLLLSSLVYCRADEPFRVHRYSLFAQLPPAPHSTIFIGNSITDMFPWNEAFGSLAVCNRGVSGSLSGEILLHIDDLVGDSPERCFLMIGTNDLQLGVEPVRLASTVDSIILRIQSLSPSTEIYLQSILPSTNGKRRVDQEKDANRLLARVAASRGVVFVDIFDDMMSIVSDSAYSLDKLHLTAYAYAEWCRRIEELVGASSRMEPSLLQTATSSAFGNSHRMRISYFPPMPCENDDILFFGDELVKGGEWAELMGNPHWKNRGTGWGYDGQEDNLAICDAIVSASPIPNGARVVLYTGVGNINGAEPLAQVEERYQGLVDKILQKNGAADLYVVSLLPTREPNPRIKQFNRWLRELSRTNAAIHYVDAFSALSSKDKCLPPFFMGNYLSGEGYLRLASLLRQEVR